MYDSLTKPSIQHLLQQTNTLPEDFITTTRSSLFSSKDAVLTVPPYTV